MNEEEIVLTPMMKQFLDLKAKHPDAVMLFRCGDFYETYSTDAIVAAEILGITLTKRANGKGKTIEMAGFPHHALDTYLPKLVRAGKRVAICDQLEDPKMTKKLVKRGITELVTPGVSINDNILNYKENNFLAAVHFGKTACGVAFLDMRAVSQHDGQKLCCQTGGDDGPGISLLDQQRKPPGMVNMSVGYQHVINRARCKRQGAVVFVPRALLQPAVDEDALATHFQTVAASGNCFVCAKKRKFHLFPPDKGMFVIFINARVFFTEKAALSACPSPWPG